jgi:hypothetical protein
MVNETITTISPAGHRGVDIRDEFVTKQEAFQDDLTETFVTEINTVISEINSTAEAINTSETNVNNKEASVVEKEALVNPHYDNIDTVATNITSVNSVATNMPDILDAEENAQIAVDSAQIALATANYAGVWEAGYDNGNGYPANVSVLYENGFFISNEADNLVEPTLGIDTTEWRFVMFTSDTEKIKTANATILLFDIITLDSSGGSFELDAPASHTNGQGFMVRTGNSVETNPVVLNGNGSNFKFRNETDTDINMNVNGLELRVISDGTNWRVY